MMRSSGLTEAQVSAQRMVDGLTMIALLLNSMEMIEELPEEHQDAAWQAVMLLVQKAKETGVVIAEA